MSGDAVRTGGTVSIARALWDDPEFPNEKFSEREAWIWLIAEASWKPRERRVQRTVFQLERGQLAASVRFLAEAWGWSKSRVFRFLERLEKRDMITTQSGTDATLITVCNYDKFQPAQKQRGTQAGHSEGQQRDTSGTNENKGEIKGIRVKGGGGSACAREADHPTLRESILGACGVDPVSGLTGPGGRCIGTRADMEEVGRWLRLPGIGEPEILGVVGEMMAGKRDGPPSTLRYFRPGIERLAAAKAAPPIDPSTLPVVRRGKAHGPSDRVQFDIAHREFTRRLAAGEIQRGPDPSDPFAW
ncbi:MarR family transcriptional regulator [Cereibacter azotoformans]|uniref:MarR family transcriptional regulator n=1 Tax=Cereibacter azotoformans TaxID=43057 RepID=UPI001EEC16AD|nr:MarR family transcriptional regulator [Cereibacter azotoformans]ULB09142.1 MarR family transcriptional regulator [Cereibacter azotoformans]